MITKTNCKLATEDKKKIIPLQQETVKCSFSFQEKMNRCPSFGKGSEQFYCFITITTTTTTKLKNRRTPIF